ncbi:MAG: L,D-transpeptidase, partial [Proteobacteria bacterium]|nr:L,D-transpeptidase [Pseudomonadota bacterium]
MRFRPPYHTPKAPTKTKKRIIFSIVIGLVLVLGVIGLKINSSETKTQPPDPKPVPAATVKAEDKSDLKDGLWDGPVLYFQAANEPIHLILVEKAIQKLHLYRYDGHYRLIKSYACATGEKQGKKKLEKDEKTPEGIYFNIKAFRDSKITIFGDRAFGLNYPDAFDRLGGNRGNGIFIHGSNKTISPFSTNGCVVLNNPDLEDLDQRIQFKDTPVVIGEHLPYRFERSQRDLAQLVPFLKQAMIPERYAHLKRDFSNLVVLGFEDRVVAMGNVRIQAADNLLGTSRLYLADPGKNLLVLLNREWNEEKPEIIQAKATPRPAPRLAARPAPREETRIASLVESWRKAWEGKQLDAYVAHYHPAFKSDGKDLATWKRYKKRLNKQYRRISVTVSGLKVKVDSSKARAYFKQHYRSDALSSERYKRLEFIKKGDSWKIIREETFRSKQAD